MELYMDIYGSWKKGYGKNILKQYPQQVEFSTVFSSLPLYVYRMCVYNAAWFINWWFLLSIKAMSHLICMFEKYYSI